MLLGGSLSLLILTYPEWWSPSGAGLTRPSTLFCRYHAVHPFGDPDTEYRTKIEPPPPPPPLFTHSYFCCFLFFFMPRQHAMPRLRPLSRSSPPRTGTLAAAVFMAMFSGECGSRALWLSPVSALC